MLLFSSSPSIFSMFTVHPFPEEPASTFRACFECTSIYISCWAHVHWTCTSVTCRVVVRAHARACGCVFTMPGPVPLLPFVPQGGQRGAWSLARTKENDRTPQRRCWLRHPAQLLTPPPSASPPSRQPSVNLARAPRTDRTPPRPCGLGAPGRPVRTPLSVPTPPASGICARLPETPSCLGADQPAAGTWTGGGGNPRTRRSPRSSGESWPPWRRLSESLP